MQTLPAKRGRKPGTPKTGGRQKGTPNKSTGRFVEQLESQSFVWEVEFLKAYREKDFQALKVLLGLLAYLQPRLKHIEMDLNQSEKLPPPVAVTGEMLPMLLKIAADESGP